MISTMNIKAAMVTHIDDEVYSSDTLHTVKTFEDLHMALNMCAYISHRDSGHTYVLDRVKTTGLPPYTWRLKCEESPVWFSIIAMVAMPDGSID
tara:strand:- start:207 stop:488 length:282 start_codon:yes stop_codon:yes gene_type:complete